MVEDLDTVKPLNISRLIAKPIRINALAAAIGAALVAEDAGDVSESRTS